VIHVCWHFLQRNATSSLVAFTSSNRSDPHCGQESARDRSRSGRSCLARMRRSTYCRRSALRLSQGLFIGRRMLTTRCRKDLPPLWRDVRADEAASALLPAVVPMGGVQDAAAPVAIARGTGGSVGWIVRVNVVLSQSTDSQTTMTEAQLHRSSSSPTVLRIVRPFRSCSGRKLLPRMCRNASNCSLDNCAYSWSTNHVTVSVHGGVVSDPGYV
jgi:hypothetical protein